MAIASANIYVSLHNGITSAIRTTIIMLTWKYYRHILSDTLLCKKLSSLTFSSDLRKPGLVPGESLSPVTKFCSVLEKN